MDTIHVTWHDNDMYTDSVHVDLTDGVLRLDLIPIDEFVSIIPYVFHFKCDRDWLDRQAGYLKTIKERGCTRALEQRVYYLNHFKTTDFDGSIRGIKECWSRGIDPEDYFGEPDEDEDKDGDKDGGYMTLNEYFDYLLGRTPSTTPSSSIGWYNPGPAVSLKFRTQLAKPVKVWFNPPYTTVEFEDGSKVTVKAEDGIPFSKFAGFSCCIAKKRFGSTANAINTMEDCERRAIEDSPKHIREERRRKEKIERSKRHQLRVERREHEIKEQMDAIRIRREAAKRIAQEDDKDE